MVERSASAGEEGPDRDGSAPVTVSGAGAGASGPRGPARGGRLPGGSRIAINTISNWVAVVGQVAVNTFLLAYVLRHFSKEEFGVYGFAASLMMAVAFLSFGMAPSLIRICATSLAREDWDRLSDGLSVARTLTWSAALAAFAGIVCLARFGLDLFNIPDAKQAMAARLMCLVGAAAACTLMAIPYRAALLARQRYELANAVVIVALFLRLGMVVAAFESGWVRLEVLGIAQALAAVLSLGGLVMLRWRILPMARISFRRFNRKALRDVVSHTFWTGLSMLSRTLRDQGAVPLVSAMSRFGVVGAGVLYLPKTASTYLLRVVSGVTRTIWPVAAQLVAEGRKGPLVRLYRVTSMLTVGIQVVALAALVTHGRLLVRYLKPEMEAWFPLFVLYVVLMVLRTGAMAGEHMLLGCGRLPHIGVSRAVVVAVGFALAAWLGWMTEAPLWVVAVALFGPGAVRGLVYIPRRIRADLGVPYRMIYVTCLLLPVAWGVVPVAVGWGLARVWPAEALWEILLQPALAALAYGVGWWFWLLGPEDRRVLRRAFRRGRRGEAKPSEAVEGPQTEPVEELEAEQ